MRTLADTLTTPAEAEARAAAVAQMAGINGQLATLAQLANRFLAKKEVLFSGTVTLDVNGGATIDFPRAAPGLWVENPGAPAALAVAVPFALTVNAGTGQICPVGVNCTVGNAVLGAAAAGTITIKGNSSGVIYWQEIFAAAGVAPVAALQPVTEGLYLANPGAFNATLNGSYVANATPAAPVIVSPAPRGGTAPGYGPGVSIVEAGAVPRVLNAMTSVWSFYGTPGTVVNVQAFGHYLLPGPAPS